MKKDILFLCQFFYPEHNSSATLPFDTAKYLAAHGFTVDALCGYPKEYSDAGSVPNKEVVNGVGIQRVRYMQLSRGNKLGRLVNYFSFTLSAMLHLLKLRKYKAVIVYSNPPILPLVAVLGSILFGTKIIFVAYDVYPEVAFASHSLRRGSLIDRGMCWINHMMYKRVSRVVALTDEMKEFLVENRRELTKKRVLTIANWAHEKRTEIDDKAYSRFGYDESKFIVSYFGNMGICQEMNTLADTVEELRERDDIRFFFVGHGNKKNTLASEFSKKKLRNVQMLDFLTGKEFEQAVAISSCCVVSLEKGLKGMCAPSKYYSYLQGGHPVIAIVEEGSYLEDEIEKECIGHAIRIGDSESLVKVICSMADHPERCREMGIRAKKLYWSKYDREIGLAKYADLFSEICKDNAK